MCVCCCIQDGKQLLGAVRVVETRPGLRVMLFTELALKIMFMVCCAVLNIEPFQYTYAG